MDMTTKTTAKRAPLDFPVIYLKHVRTHIGTRSLLPYDRLDEFGLPYCSISVL